MPGAKDTLVMVARVADLPDWKIPKGLLKIKQTASCDFCNERVVVNQVNLNEIKTKGRVPVLCCIPCYQDGAHIRGGYRGT